MKTNPDDLLNQNKKYSEHPDKDVSWCISGGLTKREYLIFNIYTKIIAENFRGIGPDSKVLMAEVANGSIFAADILINKLNK